MALPWGVGCFFDDRPYGESLTFSDWLEHLVYYYDGRFAADVAFPFVALNMMYRRRAAEQSGWFLKSHVDEPPLNAAAIQDRIRSGGESFLDRLRHFGGGALRGTDAYWSGRSDDVDAWLQYHVDEGNGVPNLFITGSCAEFQWPELLDRLEDQIFQATGDVADLREDSARRFQAVRDRSLLAQQFSQARLDLYIKEVPIPVFGVKHFGYRYEFAKSRGQIHFHMFAICAEKQPRMLLHEMRNVGGA